MTDDERKDTEGTPEESQETPAQDEGDRDAGPVGAGDPPPPAVAEASSGEVPPTPPPASDSPASDAEGQDETPPDDAQDEAPAEESDEPPAAEQEEKPEAQEEAPAETEKKKDVIPGADLEPIAVEPEERPLSAEEQARREAEEEEQRAREAALTADTVEEQAARAPAEIEGDSRYLATGKRKNAIARVTLLPGKGSFEVNGRPIEEFFPRPLHQTTAKQPLTITGYESNVDVRVRVHGGGISGQAGAVRHGIARALIEVDPELRGELKRRGFLTRDARAKERRKAGLKKARKRPQFSKR
jgi:small subunit ribosomal protein S9